MLYSKLLCMNVYSLHMYTHVIRYALYILLLSLLSLLVFSFTLSLSITSIIYTPCMYNIISAHISTCVRMILNVHHEPCALYLTGFTLGVVVTCYMYMHCCSYTTA